jgi:RNA polymerase sigma factor (sigma-70 family)
MDGTMSVDPEFEALVARVRQGDPQAAGEFYDSCKDHILRSIRYRLKHYAQRHGLRDPDDYLQSALAAFWEALNDGKEFFTREDFIAWMRKVAQNKINKDARRNRNQLQRVALEEVQEDKLVSGQPTPEQFASAEDLVTALERAFPGCRWAVQMRLAGYTLEEIGDRLHINLRFLERLFAKLRVEPLQ